MPWLMVALHDRSDLAAAKPLSGPQRLRLAVLEDVLRILHSAGAISGREGPEIVFAEAIEWARYDRGPAPFRLADICTEQGWNVAAIRRELLALGQQAQQARAASQAAIAPLRAAAY